MLICCFTSCVFNVCLFCGSVPAWLFFPFGVVFVYLCFILLLKRLILLHLSPHLISPHAPWQCCDLSPLCCDLFPLCCSNFIVLLLVVLWRFHCVVHYWPTLENLKINLLCMSKTLKRWYRETRCNTVIMLFFRHNNFISKISHHLSASRSHSITIQCGLKCNCPYVLPQYINCE